MKSDQRLLSFTVNQQIESTIEQSQIAQPSAEVVAHGEVQGNQQEPPAEVEMWNVIMSFKDSFRLLFEYLYKKFNVLVQDIRLGSLSITVRCSSLQSLEGLWEDYISGHLKQVIQETLVTREVLENLGLEDLKLKVFISEEKYHNGKLIFAENSGKLTSLDVLLISVDYLLGARLTATFS